MGFFGAIKSIFKPVKRLGQKTISVLGKGARLGQKAAGILDFIPGVSLASGKLKMALGGVSALDKLAQGDYSGAGKEVLSSGLSAVGGKIAGNLGKKIGSKLLR